MAGLEGGQGVIRQFDGVRWEDSLIVPGILFKAIWTLGPQDAVAVAERSLTGDSTTIFVMRDGVWSAINLATPSLNAAWGSSARDVFVGGEEGRTWRFDGAEWLELPYPSQPTLWGIAGSGSDDVYVVGAGGTVWHFSGT